MAKVHFSNADISLRLSKTKALKTFIERIFIMEQKSMSNINYIFCSDKFLLKINNDFLQHNYYTDIITFDLSENRKSKILGEVYISIERVKENASVEKELFFTELLRVMFHGVLHLCGYGDKKKSEITIMRQKEDYYLRLFAETFE